MDQKKPTDLVTLPAEERANALKVITAQSGKHGENEIEKLADTEGDHSAIAVLLRLNPLEIGRLIKTGDVTVPTMTAILANPQQIVEMLAMDPMAWEKELNTENLFELQNEALGVISQILANTLDRAKQLEILEAICANKNAFFYLCFPFIGINTDLDENEGVKGVFRESKIATEDRIREKIHAETERVKAELEENKDEEDEEDDFEPPPSIETIVSDVIANERQREPVIDLAEFEARQDLLELIHEIAPEVLTEMMELICETEDQAGSWEGVISQIKELRTSAEKLLGQEQDDEEYVSMFDPEKK
ncbi:MAG: hypothetical protein NTZ49_03675 [Candidatus Parcubacteria bacterium]|nr:hypothetical protein [Candidatus Parcubacteria bacterium]